MAFPVVSPTISSAVSPVVFPVVAPVVSPGGIGKADRTLPLLLSRSLALFSSIQILHDCLKALPEKLDIVLKNDNLMPLKLFGTFLLLALHNGEKQVIPTVLLDVEKVCPPIIPASRPGGKELPSYSHYVLLCAGIRRI
jgi:hypothetical protein